MGKGIDLLRAAAMRAGRLAMVAGAVTSLLWLAGCAHRELPAAPAPPHVAYDGVPLVFFDWGSSRLSPRAEQMISEVAEHYIEFEKQGSSPFMIYVAGFTDASGPAHYNFLLGLRRAERVASELERLGWDRKFIVVGSCGATLPLVPTPRGIQEPQNRRVEFPAWPAGTTPTCPAPLPQ